MEMTILPWSCTSLSRVLLSSSSGAGAPSRPGTGAGSAPRAARRRGPDCMKVKWWSHANTCMAVAIGKYTVQRIVICSSSM
jgi:hypothetical protein